MSARATRTAPAPVAPPGFFGRLFGRPAPAARVEPRLGRRDYAFGANSRLHAGWVTDLREGNSYIRDGLRAMRARSRELARNDDYTKRFLRLLRTNIVGSAGITLRVDARNPDGSADLRDGELVQRQFVKWSRRGVPTVDRRLSMRDLQALIITTVARDGEFLAKRVRQWRGNKWGYAVQVLDADFLDETYTVRLANGNRVVMGVELDQGNAAIAYHVWTSHPSGDLAAGSRERVRIPAEDIVHAYLVEFPNQVRGVPWLHTAGPRLRQLNKYEEAELIASRAAASKMGFLYTEDGDFGGDPDAEDGEGGEGGAGTFTQDLEPGQIDVLPESYKFQGYDPQHPTAQFASFVKGILRGVSAGLGVSYVALANDLEGVNYSSIRQGALDDRDVYRDLQTWLAEAVLTTVFEDWLESAFLYGRLDPIPPSRFEKVNAPVWQPRGWAWVDPAKEIAAREREVALGVTSRRRIAAEKGVDFDQVQRELEAEEGARRVYAPPSSAPSPAPTSAPAASEETEKGGDDGEAEA